MKRREKRKLRRSRQEAVNTVSADDIISGRRGRRSMPAVRNARRLYSQGLRRVASHQKSIRQDQVSLAATTSRKIGVAMRARIKASTSLLKKARKGVQQVVKDLRQVLKVEAARSRALVQSRAMTLYKAGLQAKSGADLDRAVIRFASAWKKKRSKIVSKKLAARLKKEAAKSRIAVRKANAKARESVKRAESLAKARARKAAAKTRAKIRKLMVKAKARARLASRKVVSSVVSKTTRKTRLAAVSTRKAYRKKRGN